MSELKIIDNNLMDVKEAAAYLKVPAATIYNYTMKGKIPHSHLGKLLRFRKADIDDWLSETGCDGKGLGS